MFLHLLHPSLPLHIRMWRTTLYFATYFLGGGIISLTTMLTIQAWRLDDPTTRLLLIVFIVPLGAALAFKLMTAQHPSTNKPDQKMSPSPISVTGPQSPGTSLTFTNHLADRPTFEERIQGSVASGKNGIAKITSLGIISLAAMGYIIYIFISAGVEATHAFDTGDTEGLAYLTGVALSFLIGALAVCTVGTLIRNVYALSRSNHCRRHGHTFRRGVEYRGARSLRGAGWVLFVACGHCGKLACAKRGILGAQILRPRADVLDYDNPRRVDFEPYNRLSTRYRMNHYTSVHTRYTNTGKYGGPADRK